MHFDFHQINPWGALAGGLGAFALGGLWFSPLLFGRSWATSVGKKPEELGSPVAALAIFLVTAIVRSFGVAVLFQVAGIDTALAGLGGGLLLGTILLLSHLSAAGFHGTYAKKWWWIQAANEFLGILLVAAIVGASAPVPEAFDLNLKTFYDGIRTNP